MTAHFSHRFDPSILREYDVRGVVGKTLHASDAYALGRIFGGNVKRDGGKRMGLCYDGRHSSPEFAREFARGCIEMGLDVEDYGLAPTPLGYYALRERDIDAVTVITGSHNPPDYNGIKMALKSGPVYGDTIQQFGQQAIAGGIAAAEKHGQYTKIDIRHAYVQRLVRDYDMRGQKPLKIIWDAGNGATGAILKQLTDALPGEHHLLFADVDGDFPNHHPDPAVEKNLAALQDNVRTHKADLGIAFDGDGDRIGVVDGNGKMIWSDQLTALYAIEILQRQPGAKIILDIKCSQSAAKAIEDAGGELIWWKSGHSLMKKKMQETGAALGGELSGHIFFKDGFYGHDDAPYCAIRALNLVHALGPLAALHGRFTPMHNTPEMRFDVPESDKFAIMERAKAIVEDEQFADMQILAIDGLRVTNADGWWLLRASNTQNALTARIESNSAEGLQRLIKTFKSILQESGSPIPEEIA